jgi:hypothetical protein
VVAVSTFGWILRGLVGIVIAVAIYVIGAGIIAKFKVTPPAEPDPEQIVPVDQRFRCTVCGAEVTMTAAQQDEEITAPRHCREDMVPVGV